MNKKLLLTLFAIPVAFLAADKVLGLNTPHSVKEAPRPRVSTYGSAPENIAAHEFAHEEVRSLAELDPKTLAKLTDAVKVMQAEEFIAAMEEQYHSSDYAYQGYEGYPDKLWTFLDKEVEDVLEETNVFSIDLDRQFSRCASGYRYVIFRNDEVVEKGSGYMVRDEGCWDRPIAVFQYDLVAKDVHVDMPGDLGALSIRDFLKLYEKAMNG